MSAKLTEGSSGETLTRDDVYPSDFEFRKEPSGLELEIMNSHICC